MALENQTFKAPAIPKMGKNIVSSSVFSGVSKSIKSPQLKKSKIRFSPLTTTKKTDVEKLRGDAKKSAKTIDAEKLKGDTKKEEQKIQSTKTLQETNSILAEIQNQLALDYANRILERKQRILASRKVQRKQKLKEKEDFVEKGPKFSAIKKTFDKITSPIRSIFDKLLDFLTLVGGGILLNKAWEWLSDPENRKKFIDTIKFLTDHWKWIVGAIVGAKLLKGIFKLIGFLGKIRKLINIFRKKPPNTGGGRKGGKTNPNNPKSPGGGCGPVTGKGGCLDQLSPTSDTARNLAKTLFSTAFAVNYFKGLIPNAAPVTTPLQEPEKTVEKPDDEPVSPDPPKIPVFNVNELMLKAPGTYTDAEKKFLDSKDLDFYKSGQTQTPGVDAAAFIALFAAVKTAPFWGPALLTQAGKLKNLFVKPNVVPKTQQALQQSASRSLQTTSQAVVKPQQALATVRGRTIQRPPGMSDKGYQELVRGLRLQGGRSNQTTRPIRDRVTDRAADKIRDAAAKDKALKSLDKTQQLEAQYQAPSAPSFLERLTRDMTGRIPIGRSKGGTIPGKGSPIVDSVSAMLAPGEEVIRTSSSNMFRPVLKDINDNAGRLFTDFEKGTFLQEKQILLSKDTNESFGKSAEKFDEMVEKLLRKQQKEKEDRLRDKIRDGGGIIRVLNRMRLPGQTNNITESTTRQHNDPRNPIGQQVGPEELPVIPLINNGEQKSGDVLTLNNVTPKVKKEPPIRTYTAKNNRSLNTSPTFATLPLPAQVLADQGNPPPIQSGDVSAEPLITIMSVDSNNPAIAEAFQDYGIFT